MTVTVYSKWVNNFPSWYTNLEIIIVNNGNTDIVAPELSFDLSNIDLNTNTNIGFDYRFESNNEELPKVSGTFFETIKSKSLTKLYFGINFYKEQVSKPNLPLNLTIKVDGNNGNNGNNGCDDNGNSETLLPVENVHILEKKEHSVVLQWDHELVEGAQYEIDFRNNKFISKNNHFELLELIQNTKYSVDITVTKGEIKSKKVTFTFYFKQSKGLTNAVFVDSTAYPTPPIALWMKQTNLKGIVLGFITAYKTSDGNYTANFGGFKDIYDSNTYQTYNADVTVSDYLKQDIEVIRSEGREVVFSFGGASNKPIESFINDIDTLEEIYLKAIKNYNMKYLDFDFEGGFIAETESLERHVKVIKRIQKAHPEIKISYTLPVDGAPGLMGFNNYGEDFLKMLKKNNIVPFLFILMTMEFGQGSDPSSFECVRYSIEGSKSGVSHQRGAIQQIKEIYQDMSEKEIKKLIGICPMFGTNNNGKEFTLEDMKKLVNYFHENNFGLLSGWDLVRDFRILSKPGEFSSLISQV